MGKYFGTDGFRGEAGVSLTADHAFKIGRFLGWYYNELRRRAGETAAARIVIGKDTRRSSYMFEYSLVGGLVASGADAILYVYGRYMKERGKLLTNTVVTTVMSNFGLYKAFDALDIEYAKTAVGDKYVYEYMMQNGCRIGGEQSGHIIFSKYASTGDGILTSLKMMEVIMARKKKLSELTADLAIYPQVLENVRVHDKAAAQADVDVQAAVESVAEALGDTGRILVRESGTEPLLRVMVEAESEELCRKYVDQVVEIVRKKGHVAE